MRAVVIVVGCDRVGIIAGVCTLLANYGINILDISQTVMQNIFTMTMLVDMSQSTEPFAAVSAALKEKGVDMAVDIRIQREDIFTEMHRV